MPYPGELELKARPSLTCPRCGITSYNPNDYLKRYCGACHLFLDHYPLITPEQSELTCGYIYTRQLLCGRRIGVEPLREGYGLLRIFWDLEHDPEESWQYQQLSFALHAAATWDPQKDPEPFGWYRHYGSDRRRPYGNPHNEFIRR